MELTLCWKIMSILPAIVQSLYFWKVLFCLNTLEDFSEVLQLGYSIAVWADIFCLCVL